MLAGLLLMGTTVGGFSYRISTLSDRIRSVPAAPPGYRREWKEHVQAIVAQDPQDADFTRFMREEALRLRREHYRNDGADAASFDTQTEAGEMEVSER